MKPTKNAISFVIYSPDRMKILLVQRPADDAELPNLWGLPATSLKQGESFVEAVQRAGREKLGVELEVGPCMNEGKLERAGYILCMKLYEATIVAGMPKVPQQAAGTQYAQVRWGAAQDLVPAAQRGSLCCRLFLESIEG